MQCFLQQLYLPPFTATRQKVIEPEGEQRVAVVPHDDVIRRLPARVSDDIDPIRVSPAPPGCDN
jgi:hypothetical protein